MPLLVAISIFSFCFLFWIALVTARRLRARGRRFSRATHGTRREFFESGDVRAPRSLRLLQRLSQNVSQQSRVVSPQAAAPAPPHKAPQSIGHDGGSIYNKDLGASQSVRTAPVTGRKVL
jgi:hypothetical protein